MKWAYYLLIILLLPFSSCSKETDAETYGDITLSSKFYGTTLYYVYGFSFELNESVPSINSGGKLYDIIPENVMEPGGNVIGVQLGTEPGNQNGILLNNSFENLSEAQNYFMNYTNAIDGPWQNLSDTISAFQVYTFKSYLNNFVKFYVKDVRIIDGNVDPDYVEVDIHYYIQADGSPVFSE